jgi:hypothetical protein
VKGRDQSEDTGKIILEWMSGKQYGKLWTGFMWLKIGASVGIL